MTIDEHAKEEEWTATDVRRLVPRRSSSPQGSEQPRSIFSPKRPVVVDGDDDPGPSAA